MKNPQHSLQSFEEDDTEQLIEILATGMAHAFNNVMASVRASLQVARDRVGTEALPPEVAGIENVLARGALLTRSLLTLSHARDGRRRPLHLLDMVEETLELVEPGLSLHNVSITRNYVRAPVIHAARAAAQRAILRTMLVTATLIDASDRDIRLAFGGTAAEPAFEITFNRAPMQATLIDAHYARVSRYLESAGGRLRIEAAEHGATRVRLEFVAAARSVDPLPLPKNRATPTTRELSVLVIDDEAVLRRMVASYLTLHGLRVHTAEDGHRGLSLLSARTFDVVLLDLVMPSMGGEQVLETLTRMQPGVPVIVLTGLLEDDLAESLLAAGAWGVLGKPLQLDRLLEMCHEASRPHTLAI